MEGHWAQKCRISKRNRIVEWGAIEFTKCPLSSFKFLAQSIRWQQIDESLKLLKVVPSIQVYTIICC